MSYNPSETIVTLKAIMRTNANNMVEPTKYFVEFQSSRSKSQQGTDNEIVSIISDEDNLPFALKCFFNRVK